MKRRTKILMLPSVLAGGLLLSALGSLRAQSTPKVFYACYIPTTGTVYRIKEPGLNQNCTSAKHVEFSWIDGLPDYAHGRLNGLSNDDHKQYVLADGARATTNGFAVTGTYASGVIPATGPGVRLMWYPGKAAFRAGLATGAEWEDMNIGRFSVALGHGARASGDGGSTALGEATTASGIASTALGEGTMASGQASTAMGVSTTASGANSTALGDYTAASGQDATALGARATASGQVSTAMGDETTASGVASTAMGVATTASGDFSTAMGNHASANGQVGSFVYGDRSTYTDDVRATAPNSFVVRAQQIWFGRTGDQVATPGRYIETSTGAYLADGGDWGNSSDVNRKENFRDEDAAAVLEKVSRLPIRSWNYKAEASSIRHLGPTAQDFHAAFHLGGSDKAISTVDAAGVALVSVQALEQRTREQARNIEVLHAENAALRGELAALRAEIRRLARIDALAVRPPSQR